MAETVQKIYELIDRMAPFEAAESFDNVGILAGRPDAPVETALVALDLTMGAVEEAKAAGAQLVITHHPILFRGRKNLREDDPEGEVLCALVRAGLSLIAAHTNFDAARGGVSETLARTLGVENPAPIQSGLVWIGDFHAALSELAARSRERINPATRVCGADKRLSRVAVCGGAGSDLWPLALEAGADAYLLGEARHYDALAAARAGMPMIDAGHYETERPAMKALAKALQTRADAVQYKIRVLESAFEPFL